MTDVLRLERSLANSTSRPLSSHELKAFTVQEMDREFPFISWTKFFGKAFNGMMQFELWACHIFDTHIYDAPSSYNV